LGTIVARQKRKKNLFDERRQNRPHILPDKNKKKKIQPKNLSL
jgi:hypothetical protein